MSKRRRGLSDKEDNVTVVTSAAAAASAAHTSHPPLSSAQAPATSTHPTTLPVNLIQQQQPIIVGNWVMPSGTMNVDMLQKQPLISPSLSPPTISPSTSGLPRHWLSLQPQPPKYPFVNVYFPIRVFLIDAKKGMKTGWNVPIRVEALYDNGDPVEVSTPIFQLHPDHPPRLGTDGVVSLKIRFLQVSMRHENRAFQLRFSAQHDEKTYGVIVPVQSTAFTVIRHQLRVTEHPPSIWYKDEGGRDKCISVSGMLVDENDAPVQNREIPLKVTLVYEGEGDVEVKNQSILKIPSEVAPKIDRYGKVNLKLRIEEVSKNHQKQAFAIKLAPDIVYNPANMDISADVSKPITVLSKRNKRRKKETNDTGGGGTARVASIVNSGTPTPPPPPAASSMNAPAASPTNRKPGTAAAVDALLIAAQEASPVPASTSQSKAAGFVGFSGCVNGLITWCQMSFKAMSDIQWQHVGFEVVEDGTVNLHRPLLRCPACWVYKDTVRPANHAPNCPFQRCISMYHPQIFTHLQELVSMANGQQTLVAQASIPNGLHPQAMTAQTSSHNPHVPHHDPSFSFGHNSKPSPFHNHNNNDSDEEEESDEEPHLTTVSSSNTSMPPPLTSAPSTLRGLPVLPPFAGLDPRIAHRDVQPAPPGALTHSALPVQPNGPLMSAMERQNSLIALHPGYSAFGMPELSSLSSITGLELLEPLTTGSMMDTTSGAQGGGASVYERQHDGAVIAQSGAYMSEEHQVHAVIVVPTVWGYPAFNSRDELIGFYHNDGGTNVIVFVPLSHSDAKLDASTLGQLREAMVSHRRDHNKAFFSLDQHITLERLKENILLYIYESDSAGVDPSNFLS